MVEMEEARQNERRLEVKRLEVEGRRLDATKRAKKTGTSELRVECFRVRGPTTPPLPSS